MWKFPFKIFLYVDSKMFKLKVKLKNDRFICQVLMYRQLYWDGSHRHTVHPFKLYCFSGFYYINCVRSSLYYSNVFITPPKKKKKTYLVVITPCFPCIIFLECYKLLLAEWIKMANVFSLFRRPDFSNLAFGRLGKTSTQPIHTPAAGCQ